MEAEGEMHCVAMVPTWYPACSYEGGECITALFSKWDPHSGAGQKPYIKDTS